MTKKELRQYKGLLREQETQRRYIEKLEKRAESVPIVKDKVQTSQKEWPYLLVHEIVDAPVPVEYSKLQHEIVRAKKLHEKALLETVKAAVKIELWIQTFEEARTRAILRDAILNERPQKDIAIEHDLTEARISEIITEAVNEKNISTKNSKGL